MKIFKKNKYYIKLFVNRIEILDITNGKKYAVKSNLEFNNTRLLIADFNKAESFIKGVFKQYHLSTRYSIGIIQQMEMSEGGLSDVEKRILLEVFNVAGINEIHIDESLTELTQKELAVY